MRRVTFKLGNMRKPADWVVYPAGGVDGKIVVQSATRIAEFHPVTGEGVLSKACANGAYFIHLNRALGATAITVPPEVIALVREAQPKSGDKIGPGVYVA